MISAGRFFDLPDRDQPVLFGPSLRQALADDPELSAFDAARKQIVEPVLGRFKHNWGFRRLLLRGRSGAQAEWSLACIGHNLSKLIQAGGPPRPRSAQGQGRTTTSPQPQVLFRVFGGHCRFAYYEHPRRVAAA